MILFVHGLAFLLALQGRMPADPPVREPVKGMTVTAYWNGLYSDARTDATLAQLAGMGVNWISLVPVVFQENSRATSIFSHPGATVADQDLAHAIAEAHRLGLKVMLKPHLNLLHPEPLEWRGWIGRSFTDEDWRRWFASYREHIVSYAELAEGAGADLLCIGTELTGTVTREAEWREVASAVRAKYRGAITFAANHGGEEMAVRWWDALDYIGVNPYYKLTMVDDPTMDELRAAWKRLSSDLGRLASKWKKSILFTEIAYASREGTNREPWNAATPRPVDLQEQVDCMRAMLETAGCRPWFAGFFWWSWDAQGRGGGPEDTSHSPIGKPVENLLRDWYGGSLSCPKPVVSRPGVSRRGLRPAAGDPLGIAVLQIAIAMERARVQVHESFVKAGLRLSAGWASVAAGRSLRDARPGGRRRR